MLNQCTVILGTGGTIAGRAARMGDNVGYKAGAVGIDDLLSPLVAAVPQLAGRVLVGREVARVDSKDMGPVVWLALLLEIQTCLHDPAVAAVVVTHGTDTVEETAFLVEQVLQPKKPVVFTCAMRPTTALVPDGPQNLLDALAVAQWPGLRGVLVVAAGRVHAPSAVSKVHPYRLDAFDSGERGVLACIEEGRVRWLTEVSDIASSGAEKTVVPPIDFSQLPWCSPRSWPRVEVVFSHAGAGPELVDAMASAPELAAVGGRPLAGLVVAATGNGTVNQDLLAALVRAQNKGVVVWRTTRCALGQVVEGDGPSWAPTSYLPPVKARIALMLYLMGAKAVRAE